MTCLSGDVPDPGFMSNDDLSVKVRQDETMEARLAGKEGKGREGRGGQKRMHLLPSSHLALVFSPVWPNCPLPVCNCRALHSALSRRQAQASGTSTTVCATSGISEGTVTK